MKRFIVAAAVVLAAIVFIAPASAQNATGKSDDLAKQAGAGDVKKSETAKPKSAKPRTSKAKKSSGGREAANARRKACGAEWKADKAAGKVEAGMKWPQFWSACNKSKKGASA